MPRPHSQLVTSYCLTLFIATPAHQRVAYGNEELSKHRMKLPLYDIAPKTENSWIAPNATVSKCLIIQFTMHDSR